MSRGGYLGGGRLWRGFLIPKLLYNARKLRFRYVVLLPELRCEVVAVPRFDEWGQEQQEHRGGDFVPGFDG